ncbi:ABC transporter permease [Pleomorphomonas sp. JP5]|uniref:ABC transporter permease n=1 Tax=Pleomorphomonas sp. JP5 TaxID=2942998 RepID=UPI002043C550|nr:ABC transporter permease [Pleomorphomonas sp. JP5]MCM5557674.1 ABC transporter permease [Pleomorphomonas sp. JP5]
MTFFRFTWKNIWRKPLRTLLLTVCVSVAFLIYGLTASFLAGAQGSAGSSDDILGVMSSAGRSHPLPLALLPRITSTPGVAAVTYTARLRGFVGTEKNVVNLTATDPDALLAINGRELGLSADLVGALGAARDRILVGRALADAQGWTVGQQVALTAFQTARQDGDRNWRFEIAGIFEGENASTDTYFMIGRYDYLNAARARDKDTVDAFILRPGDGVSTGALAARIDAAFANSASPTRTQSEKQFLEAFLRQYADVGLIIDLVVGASFTTLLLIVVNTMVFAIRERTFEIGLLKTLGFSRWRILSLVLGETLLIFLAGGVLGLALAKLGAGIAGPALGLILSAVVLAKALALILGLGLATGALPAANAMRIPVTAAFRTR